MIIFSIPLFQCQEKPLNKLMEVPQSSDSEPESGDEHLNLVLRMRFVLINLQYIQIFLANFSSNGCNILAIINSHFKSYNFFDFSILMAFGSSQYTYYDCIVINH